MAIVLEEDNLSKLMCEVMPLTCYIFWKSRDLAYQGGNINTLEAVGYSVASEIQGKTDFDFWDSHIAEQVRESDLSVLAGKSIVNLRETRWIKDKPKTLTINKTPILDMNNTIIGIFGFHYEITEEPDFSNFNNLLNMDVLNRNTLYAVVNENFNKVLKNKEIECLALWVNGYSIKESSDFLCLSHKTIEAYRTNIKDKVGVYNRSQLIDLAQSNGAFLYLFYITKFIKKSKK